MVVISWLHGEECLTGLVSIMLGDIQLWNSELLSFQMSHAFREENIGVDFLVDKGAFEVVVGYTETIISIQLRDLVQADRERCFLTQ